MARKKTGDRQVGLGFAAREAEVREALRAAVERKDAAAAKVREAAAAEKEAAAKVRAAKTESKKATAHHKKTIVAVKAHTRRMPRK